MKRRILVLMLAIPFFAGCGSNKKEAKFQGVERKNNYVVEAKKFLKEKNVVDAVQILNVGIRHNSANPDNYIFLGQIYLSMRDYPRSVNVMQNAIKFCPENGRLYYLLALGARLGGNKQLAVEAAKKSAEVSMKEKNAERLKMSLAMVRSLLEEEKELKPQQGQKDW